MQALVSKGYDTSSEMERKAKRYRPSQYNSPTELVTLPKRTPMHRLKLQFPNLDEEVSKFRLHNELLFIRPGKLEMTIFCGKL